MALYTCSKAYPETISTSKKRHSSGKTFRLFHNSDDSLKQNDKILINLPSCTILRFSEGNVDADAHLIPKGQNKTLGGCDLDVVLLSFLDG